MQRNQCRRSSGQGRSFRAMVDALESRTLLSGSGLAAQYFNTTDLSGTAILRNEATVNFNWGNGAPDNALNPNGYSAQWTGKVQPLYTETYTFSITAQGGGAKLVVNGTTLINQLSATGGTWTGTIALTAGTKYSITAQYSEKGTTSSGISLSWSSASQAAQVIPASQLYVFADTDASTNYPGNSSYSPATGVLTVSGGSKTQDWIVPNNIGHFVTQTITGDVQIVARLTSMSAKAYAGITIQDGFTFGATAMRVYRVDTGAVYTGGYNGAGTLAMPFWMKVIRIGNVFTAYTSTDGVAWQISPAGTGQTLSTGAALKVGFFVSSNALNSSTLETATFDNISITSPKLDHTTSWVGNTGSGIDNKHVQNEIKGMFVASDGTIYTNSPWDEGGYEAAVYKNGQIVGSLLDTNGSFGSLHGWSRGGGWGIGADANYVYLTMGQGYLGYDQTGYPTSGSGWNCIRRYSRSTLRAAPFTGGVIDGSAVVVNTNGGALRGLWVSGTEIYVSDKDANTVDVFNSATMTLTRSFSVVSPQQITEDGSGNLWIISNPSGGSARVLCYSKAGVLQSKNITDVPVPTSVYYNPASGQLLVADDGPSQQIIKYNISGATPTRAGTLGDYGGVSAGTPGQVTATKFDNPMAVAADPAGNIYVTFNGMHPSLTSAIGIGCVLRNFAPSGSLNWELRGMQFVDSAVIDPTSDGLTLFTKDEQWALNYNTTSGEMGTWVGRTVDENVYPSDGRVTGADTNVLMQVINGQKFMFATGQSGGGWNIYKQVPGTYLWKLCGGVSPGGTWRDLNDNAAYDAGEGTSTGIVGELYSSYIDGQGNVWCVGFNTGLFKATFVGLDTNGNPIYSPKYAKAAGSTDYWNIGRVIYIPETDTMYVMGFNATYSNPGEDPRGAGCVLTRYNDWSTNPTVAWRYVMPTDRTMDDVYGGNVVNSLSLAGNRLFVSIVGTASCYALDPTTGQLITVLYRGPEIGGQGGWLDNIQGMTAYRRSNGEYVVALEDDLLAKIIIYRAGGISPTNLTATTVTTGTINLSWTDNSSTEASFILQQSTDGVNFSTIATLPANMTGYTVTGLTSGVNYFFRVKATNAFDDSPYSTATLVYTPTMSTAPTNVVATGAAGQVVLTWTDNATTETAYKVDRSTSPTFAMGTITLTLGANQSGFADTGVAATTTYYYRVYAMNGAVNLGYSATVSATTLQTLPAAPSNLRALAASSTQINLTWTDNSSDEIGFKVERATDIGFTQNLVQVLYSTGNQVSFADGGLVAGTTYYYRVRSSNAVGDSAYSAPASTRTLASLGTYGIFASSVDIGTTGAAGSTVYSAGTYTVNGAGADIWTTADALQFVSTSVTGDFTLVARIDSQTNTDQWAKAGIMVRASAAANSPFVLVGTRPDSLAIQQWRTTAGGNANDSGVSLPSKSRPNWVKLTRSGNVFTTYYSGDGVTWSQVGSALTISMGSSPLVGLAQCSHVAGTLGTTVFSNVNFATTATPTGVALQAVSDTGIPGDRITWLNNSSASSALGFTVSGTVSGATVYLYANALLVGTAVASGTSTTVTTDGTTLLADGVYNITAQQIRPTWPLSSLSPATAVTINTVAPTVTGDQGSAGQSDQIRVARNATDSSLLDVFVNSLTPTYSVNFAGLNTLAINGLGGDDTLTLDLANGPVIPAGGIRYDGGTQTSGDSLSIAGSSGNDAVTFAANQVTIGAGIVTLVGVENRSFKGGAGNDSLALGAGGYAFGSDLGVDTTHLSLSLADGAQVAFSGVQHLGSLSLAGSAKVTLADGGRSTLVVQSLSLGAASSLEVADNSVIVDYTGSNPFAGIYSLVASSAVSHWAGTGIVSHTAAGGGSQYAIGVADNSVANLASFAGQAVDSTSVLIRFTYSGDANLDGQVDLTDLSILSGSWQMAGRHWSQGDADYSGLVDLTDLSLLASNWQKVLPAPVAAEVVSLTSAAAAVVVSQTVDAAPTSDPVVADPVPVQRAPMAAPAAAATVLIAKPQENPVRATVASRGEVPQTTAASRRSGVFSNGRLPVASALAPWPITSQGTRRLLGNGRGILADGEDVLVTDVYARRR